MQWQSMKTAPRDGRIVWVTVQWEDGDRSVHVDEFAPNSAIVWDIAIAWAPIDKPTPYTGTLEELDAKEDIDV